MSLRFRKQKSIGGLRLTASKNGIGVSAGVKGARVSLGSDGKIRRTVGIPGSGISDTEVIGNLRRTDSAPAEPTSLAFDLENANDRKRLASLGAREITAALSALPRGDRKALRNAWADARYEFRMGALNRAAFRLLHPSRARAVDAR